jgi:hypothetical protein
LETGASDPDFTLNAAQGIFLYPTKKEFKLNQSTFPFLVPEPTTQK